MLFILCLGVTALAAVVGSIGSRDAPRLYPTLSRPGWAPPTWLFGPAWTVLYVCMACSLWLVIRANGWREAVTPIVIYLAQLTVNALWSWYFFAWRRGRTAFFAAIVLWWLVAATMVSFATVSRSAALLQLPVLAWVALATALTFSVWRRNPYVFGP